MCTVGAMLLVVALLQIHRLDDSDTWWHLATGRTIWETGGVPHTDPFSYTAPGAPWLNRQWLFELALYASWLVAGPAGASLLAGAGFVAAYVLVARQVRRALPPWGVAMLIALVTLVAVERFTVRPEAVTLALLATVMLLVDRTMTWRRVALLVGIQVVWANCHALSVLGLVPTGAALASALAARTRLLPSGWRAASGRPPEDVTRLVVALAGGLAAEATTPFGLAGAVYPLWLFSLIRSEKLLSFTIIEHRATRLAELSPVAGAAFVALLALTALALLASARRLRLDQALVAVVFTVLAFLARRNVALLGIGVAPLIASGLGPFVRRMDASPVVRAAAGGALTLVALVLCARVITGDFYADAKLTRTFGLGESWLLYPAGAVDFLAEHAPGARLFNDDVLGGYLIWRGRPVFFDGRLQVYPDDVYLDWQHALDDPRTFDAVARRRGISAVILYHPALGRLELARAIANLPGWRIAYLDGGAIVLLADGEAPGTPAGATGPVEAFATPGIAGALERVAAPLRTHHEQATTYYQRGRAIHYLFGPQA
ncbi:MAG: hypothetical protein ACREQL_09250, partial [Candidatus Binatia bacterium]